MSLRLARSFPTRLAASVFGLGVALVVGGGGLWYRAASDTLQERLLAQLSALVDDDADRLTAWLSRQQEAVVLLGRELAVHGGPLPTTPDTVRWAFLPPSVLAAEAMLVAQVPGGRIVRSTDRTTLGGFVVDEEYFQVGRTRPFVKKIYYAAGRPRITVAEPLKQDGRVMGVLAVHLDLVQMEATLRRRAHARDESAAPALDAYLVNRLFDFVSAERFGRAGVKRGVRSRAIDDALAGRAGAGLYNDFAGRPVVGAWRWIPELEMALVLETPQAAAFAPARALLARTLLLGFGALGVWVLGVVLITRRFTRPVLAVADAAKAVAAGDFTVTAADAADDEVGQLARAFNTMTQRLRSLYASLASQVEATQAALDRAQASRALLQDVVNNTATLVLVVGLDGRVRLANARVAALTGMPAEDAEGREVTTVLAGAASTLVPIITRARTADAVIEQEVMIDAPAGAHGWQVVAFPLAHADGTVYATGVIGTDLTERARAEAERRARDATVQQAQKLESLGVMAGGIAHDFNNILGAIMGNVEIAREALTAQGAPGAGRDDAELAASLERIGAASRRAAELTRQMLAYAGRASLRRETLDLRQVVDDIVPLVEAGQTRKVRTVVLPMDAPLWVEADPSQLSQVLLNLLTNAAEAVGDSTGSVTLSVAHAAPPNREGEAWIRVRVQDTGPGIPDAVRARIFDPFFSTKASGRGLGLSAVRGIVRSLGGVLELVTAVGEGTRFDIYLREVAPPPLAPTPSSVSLPVQVSGAVLVVDDEASIRHVARRVLGGLGFEVLDAEDGETGVARFRAHEARIVAVLLDLSMPGMSGIDVLAEIRRTHPTLPVIIASGYDHDDALRGHEADRALSFLQKPYGSAALRAEVLRVVAPPRRAPRS
ncbi:MAG: response regulator [Gemmatimonadetes bacterium]|nr:response regulator [Gemmatimonadota bacterium]